ncbi:MAG: hypothetical protein GY861_06885 [bacterium]|nr:hypothetical protein [bacterium]
MKKEVVSGRDIDEFLKERSAGQIPDQEEQIFVPITIFDNDCLSSLEAITKYLKDVLGLRFFEIAKILNRDDRTVWGAYDSARNKMPRSFIPEESAMQIPLGLFQNRLFSVLETLAVFLKEEHNLTYSKIGTLLNRNQRTVWTVYQRAKRKARNAI